MYYRSVIYNSFTVIYILQRHTAQMPAVISLTAYCLACQFGVPVRSLFSLFSRGRSHFGFIQMNVKIEINTSRVDCRCALANFQCLHLFWWIDLIAHNGPRMKFIFEALVLVSYFTLSLSPTEWSWIFKVNWTFPFLYCGQRNEKFCLPVCKFRVYGLILSITFDTEGGFIKKSQKSVWEGG